MSSERRHTSSPIEIVGAVEEWEANRAADLARRRRERMQRAGTGASGGKQTGGCLSQPSALSSICKFDRREHLTAETAQDAAGGAADGQRLTGCYGRDHQVRYVHSHTDCYQSTSTSAHQSTSTYSFEITVDHIAYVVLFNHRPAYIFNLLAGSTKKRRMQIFRRE